MRKFYLIYITLCSILFSCSSTKKQTASIDMEYINFQKQQKHWKSPDGKISYIDKGEGKPLLLLHGIPTSGWLYRKIIDPLVDKGYRVIAPEMLGFGMSDHPEGYDIYDKTAHAERILGLMKHLGIDNWHHVMHDAGGVWTWELLKKDPTKINRLSILNTIIYQEGFDPPIHIKKGLIGKIIMWSYRKNTRTMLAALFENGTEKCKLTVNEMQGYVTPLKRGKTDALYKFFTTNTKSIPDYSPVLKSLDIPVQVIWGKHDDILLWEKESKRVSSDLKILPENIHVLDKNHFLQEEASDELIELIGAFQ